MEFSFYYEDIDNFEFKKESVSRWINEFIDIYGYKPGELCFIFCSDEYMLSINKKFRNLCYYTDVIAFDYVENRIISGDIFISIDRVRENSFKYSDSFNSELYRVIAHAVLHLMGYKDNTDVEKKIMKRAEDKCLSIFKL